MRANWWATFAITWNDYYLCAGTSSSGTPRSAGFLSQRSTSQRELTPWSATPATPSPRPLRRRWGGGVTPWWTTPSRTTSSRSTASTLPLLYATEQLCATRYACKCHTNESFFFLYWLYDMIGIVYSVWVPTMLFALLTVAMAGKRIIILLW